MPNDLQDFEQDLRVRQRLADRSVQTYLHRVGLFLREFGVFSADTLIEWKDNQVEALKSPNYINQGLIAFRKYIDFKGWDIPIPKSVPSQKKQYLDNVITRADYDFLCRYLVGQFGTTKSKKYERLYIAVRIMGTTGLRLSELLNVKVEDIKLGVFDIYGKRTKNRRIYIPVTAQKELLGLLGGMGVTSGYAVLDRDFKRYKEGAFQQAIKGLAEETEIDSELMHPHGFRHFFAKEFIRNHNDICLLADLLGHSNLETTRIYLKMTSREQADVVDKVVTW